MQTQLREALDHLRANGWFQGTCTNQGNVSARFPERKPGNLRPSCMMTAVEKFSGTESRDIMALAEVCVEQFPERSDGYDSGNNPVITVVLTNNHPDTTFGDVEMLMEKAAVQREPAV